VLTQRGESALKEYLGLGVIFSAVDKGLARSLKMTGQSLEDVDKKLAATEKTANAGGRKGGIFGGVAEGLKMLSISHIGSTLNDMHEAMSGVGGGIEDTFKKLDTLKTKLTFTFDPDQAKNLNTGLLTTKHNLGLTGDETEILAQNMMEFGRSTDEAIKSLPMMGKLVGTLGLDAGKVSQMYGQGLATLRATPAALDGLMKEVVSIQKAYHLTDQISQLPEIFETVTKNSAMFGKVNATTALNTVRSISGLSAVFQKVGLSQSGALKAATGFSDKLSSMKRSVADMRAGLAPLDEDLYEAANTLTLMGYNGEQAFQKMFEGADDPMKLAKELNGQFMTLSKDQQDIVAARFRRTFGDEATNLLQGYGDEAKAALNVKPDKEEKSGKTFDDYTKAMGTTVDVQTKINESAKEHLELMTEFANKTKTVEILQKQTEFWNFLSSAVTKTTSALGSVLKTLGAFKSLGLPAFFTELAPLGIALGLLTPLIFPLTNLVSLLKIFGKLPFTLIAGGFSLIFSGPALAIAGLVSAAYVLMKIFKVDFADVAKYATNIFGKMSDSFNELTESFSTGDLAADLRKSFDKAAVFITEFFADLIPIATESVEKMIEIFSNTFNEFLPIAKAVLGNIFDLSKEIFSGIGDYLQGMAPVAKKVLSIISGTLDKVGHAVGAVVGGFKNLFQSMTDGEKVGKSYGKAISGVGSFIDAVSTSGLSIKKWAQDLIGLKDFFSGVLSVINGVISAVISFSEGFAVGLFGGIQDNMPELIQTFMTFKTAAMSAFDTILKVILPVVSAVGSLLSYLGDGAAEMTGFNTVGQLLGFTLGKVFSALVISIGFVVNSLLGLVTVFGKLLDIIATIGAAFAFSILNPIDAIKLAVSLLFESIQKDWNELFDKIPAGLKSFLGMIPDSLDALDKAVQPPPMRKLLGIGNEEKAKPKIQTTPLVLAPPQIGTPAAIAPKMPASAAAAPMAKSPLALAPKIEAPTMVVPKIPAPTAIAPVAKAPLALAPKIEAPTMVVPKIPAPTAIAPVAPVAKAPLALAPKIEAPTAIVPKIPAPTAIAPVAKAPLALAPKIEAPTAILPSIPMASQTIGAKAAEPVMIKNESNINKVTEHEIIKERIEAKQAEKGKEPQPEPFAKVIPIKQQQGVPAAPTYTNVAAQKPEQVSDPNIQALINEVSKLSQAMMQYAQAVSDRPVNVAIEGDLKKLFRALNQEQKNQMGSRMAGGSF
jgi:hypothetical protein